MENLSYLIIKASRHLKNALDKRLSAYDLTAAQFSVLNQVYHSNGQITSAEIATILASDRPTISGIVNRLEQKELLKKVVNPKDKRSVFLELDPETMSLVETLRAVSNDLNQELFKDLKASEVDQVKKVLASILKVTDQN